MTKRLNEKVSLALGIILIALICSCAGTNREQMQERINGVGRQAQSEIASGKFQRTIDIYREIYQAYPQDPTVRSEYIKVLVTIKTKGDQAFKGNDFPSAEEAYGALLRNWPHFADFSQSLSFDRNVLEKMAWASKKALTERQVHSYIDAGDFKKAIVTRKEFAQEYPQEPTAQRDYIKTLELVTSRGNRAFEKSNYPLAGRIYAALLKSRPSSQDLSFSYSYDTQVLNRKLEACRKILFERGLERYRSGDLSDAISIWRSILAFDPDNEEIKKAVATAVLQYKRLKVAR